jgi:acetylornithine deacetylase/succinyl-diaminopimelate desuccinylase-like protein
MVASPACVRLAPTLSPRGNTITIDDDPQPRPLSAEESAMIADASQRRSEEKSKKSLSVSRWIDDLPWEKANERLESQPTVNIEGVVGGYTGPGGKTSLPQRAAAKLDLRLVPDMTKDAAVAALKAHLAKRGFGDIEVNVTGGYDPTSTPSSARLTQANVAVLKRAGIVPVMWPRNAGSYPGYVFTGEPLKLASGHFGLGHGSGAHAPDEYYLIESANPKVQGFDGAVLSFAQYLYELAK